MQMRVCGVCVGGGRCYGWSFVKSFNFTLIQEVNYGVVSSSH